MSRSLPPVRIEIRPSQILPGEVGLFAARSIRKNDLVAELSALRIRTYEWPTYEQADAVTREKIWGFCSGVETEFYGPEDFNYLTTAWYMNHSCEPNVGYNDDGDFVAMRDITAGEELCWDYSFDDKNPSFSMDCACGAESCRQRITGNDWKFLILDKEKFPYIAKYIRDMHERDHQS
jgi:SET domain-containing protein